MANGKNIASGSLSSRLSSLLTSYWILVRKEEPEHSEVQENNI